MTAEFTQTERDALREHGIVLWVGRVIYEAQPPMSDEAIAAVEAQCAGPIPDDLRRLWRCTAGGSLAYDLTLEMDDQPEAISWTELFYNGSDGYRDLQGWIDHELELLEEICEEDERDFDGKLEWLPIGGFEYPDRVYVCVSPGDEHGQVIAWKQGLPPAWKHRLHEDAVATIAGSLDGAFAALSLEQDPEVSPETTGMQFLQYLDERVEAHGLPRSLADRVAAFYRRAFIDWRSLLAEGELDRHPSQARVAIGECIDRDDSDALSAMREVGVDLGMKISGGAMAVDLALSRNAWRSLGVLLRLQAPVPEDALLQIAGAIPPELVAAAIAGGARSHPEAAVACIAVGAPASAEVIIERLSLDIGAETAASRVREAADRMRLGLEQDLAQVESGHLHHHLGKEGLQARIERLSSYLSGSRT